MIQHYKAWLYTPLMILFKTFSLSVCCIFMFCFEDPLTSITSQLTTNIPTTSSLISTQIKTSSSVPVATPSFTSKVISSSSIDAASPLYLPTSYKLTSTFVSITSPVGKSSMFVDLSMRSMVSAKHVTKSYFAPMSSIVQSSPTSNILHSSKKSIPSFQPSYPPSKKVTARSISVFSKSKVSLEKPSYFLTKFSELHLVENIVSFNLIYDYN